MKLFKHGVALRFFAESCFLATLYSGNIMLYKQNAKIIKLLMFVQKIERKKTQK